MDIALTQRRDGTGFGISVAGTDLAAETSLRTQIIYSLLTDRRAEPDDPLPYPQGNDRRGSWADQYLPMPGDLEGSRLWLLERARETQQTLDDAKAYAEEALAWLVDDGVATSVTVTAEWARPRLLGLLIDLLLSNGTPWADRLLYPLGAAA